MAKFWLGKVGNRVEWWLDDVREGFFFFLIGVSKVGCFSRYSALRSTPPLQSGIPCKRDDGSASN